MGYCTQTDILGQMEEAELIRLTDDANDGVVDVTKVAAAIAGADTLIDSYCGTRYVVPFTTVPGLIRDLSVDMAIYNLCTRRRGASEDRKARYNSAIARLKDIQAGKSSLGENDPAGTPAASGSPKVSAGSRVFSSETLAGF